MNHQVLLKPEAEIDLREIFEWYDGKMLGLGDKFLEDFYSKINQVKNFPHSYQVHYKKFRFAFLTKFPVSIHFVIEERRVVVLGIFPTAGNPANWS